jgi:hypothetical protein
MIGCAVAQAVSRWLRTPAARVPVRAAYGVCGGQSDTGTDFLRVLRFPLQLFLQFPHENHPGLAQYTNKLPQCRVDPIGLHPPLYQFKKKVKVSLLQAMEAHRVARG